MKGGGEGEGERNERCQCGCAFLPDHEKNGKHGAGKG